MASIKPYTLKQAQAFVHDAKRRMKPFHEQWDFDEHLYATGSVEGFAASTGQSTQQVGQLVAASTGLPPEVINLCLPHMNIILASIFARDPKVLCEPISGDEEATASALINEQLVRYFWKRSNATSDAQDASKDMGVIGNGIVKVSWDFEEEERDRPDDEVYEDLSTVIEADLEVSKEEGTALTPFEDLSTLVDREKDLFIVKDEPLVSYVDPRRIFVPADARRMWETSWVAEEIVKPVEELAVKFGKQVEDFQSSKNGSWNPEDGCDPFAVAVVYEFYDMRSRRLLVFQLDAAEPLVDEPLPYSHRYPPYVHFVNYRKSPKDFWGFGDMRNTGGLQTMYNEVFQLQLDNMRRSGNKVFIDEDAMTPQVEAALRSSVPDLAIKVKRPEGVPLGELVVPVPRQALSNDIYNMSNTVETAMASTLGLSDFQRGLSGADRMSGTAASAVEGNSALRAQDKLYTVEAGIAQIALLIILLSQEFLSEDTAVRIVGPRGAKEVKVSPEDIQGEFKFTVEGGSTRAVNPVTRSARAAERATLLLPILQQNGYDVEPLLRGVVADMQLDPDIVLRKVEAPAEAPAEEMPADPMMGGLPPMPPDLGPHTDLGGLAADAALQGDVL